VLDGSENLLSILARINLEVVTGLQVGCKDALRVIVLIAWQDFKRNIMVLKFIVAQSNINIDCLIFSAFEEKLLVNFGCLFIMAPQIVNSRQS
jgi:hypothetical protein